MEYKKRIADGMLRDKLDAMGAILIEGPKACGKTTTAEQIAGSVLYMDDPDKMDTYLQLVDTNIKLLLAGETPRLIDEWQIAPKFWDAIRHEVDRRDEDGQFILTGSAVPAGSEKIFHSGAARYGFLTMRTMSLWESGESSGSVSLGQLFRGTNTLDGKSSISIEDLAFLTCRGGWPWLAGNGYNIAMVASSAPEKNEEAVNEVKALGVEAKAYQCDVADFDKVGETVAQIIEDFGGIYILVNNAGITRDGLMLKMSEENFDSVISVNLKGTFNFIKHCTPVMMKKREGRVVNISSIVGLQGNAGQANYSASKAGIIGMTKSCAREFASRNITFNAVAPGFVETSMTAVLTDKQKEGLFELIPLKRYGQPEDIAAAVAFLCSDDASYITGQVLSVDGGMHM